MVFFSDRVDLMARELTRSACDLGDGREVIRLLRSAGFTKQEMDMGLEEALERARFDRINDAILAGLAGGEWPGAT